MRDALLVAATEPSADALAAAVVPALRARFPDMELVGLCGPRMRELGVRPLGSAEDLGVLGLVEALPRLGAAWRARRALLQGLRGAAAFVSFDGPDLLLGVARRARDAGVPAVHVVCPQVWAWRPRRVATVARSVDALACLFPFEPPLFEGTGLRAVYTGHPLAVSSGPRHPEAGLVGLLPGSRPSEWRRHWPLMCAVARRMGARVLTALPPGVPDSVLPGMVFERAASVAELARRVEVALVASGTATLEVAMHGCPQVVVARVHPLTAFVARRLLTTPFLALPNVLLGRRAVAEHVMSEDVDAIVADLRVARPVTLDLVGGQAAAGAIVDLVARTVLGG